MTEKERIANGRNKPEYQERRKKALAEGTVTQEELDLCSGIEDLLGEMVDRGYLTRSGKTDAILVIGLDIAATKAERMRPETPQELRDMHMLPGGTA